MRSTRFVLPPLLGCLFAQGPPPAAAPVSTFANTVRPFLENYCQSCHNGKTHLGDVNFEVLKYATGVAAQTGTWETTAYVLKTGRMPPAGAPRPPEAQANAAREVLEAGLVQLGERKSPASAPPPTREWLTWQVDAERTGWARGETTLTKANAGALGLLWRSQLDAAPSRVNGYSTLTDPLVAEGVRTAHGVKTLVFTASAENNVYALDADTGSVIWQRRFPNAIKPPTPSGNCPNNLNATPVIDKQNSILYVLTNEGKLRAFGLGDGEDRMTPVEFTEPYSRNWSLNLIDGWIYTSTSRGCGGATSVITAVDLSKPSHPVARFYPSTGKASGPWGRGGIVRIPTGVVAQTADGAYDPAGGRFGNTLAGLTKDLRLNDSFTPANWDYLNRKDFDLGVASPTVFEFDKWTLVAAAAKEGVIYLLDAKNLGGDNHMTPLYVSPRYGNDALLFGYNGVWGSISTWVDAKGERWLMVPMMGPPAKETAPLFGMTDGKVVNGSVMAFKVKKKDGKPVLDPVWMSGDLDSPGMPVMAGGVVWVIATGDRARDVFRQNFGGASGSQPPRRRFGGPENQVNPGEPGAERDAAWLTSQNEPGGQAPGRRYSGGRDVTNAVLYGLDADTGKEIYSSKESIDSWNHYGGIALASGRIYLSTYDARVFAFGLAPSR
ncbi:MAG: PQQ-binding-like beta-propeller repeat protein [Acidobacteria bacterium]|nr:PQQ-binding-like beta-propeller repeat protein [Acidobacteriota bacterium]